MSVSYEEAKAAVAGFDLPALGTFPDARREADALLHAARIGLAVMAPEAREKIARVLYARINGSPFGFGAFPGTSLETQCLDHADAILSHLKDQP